jgi:hypothetical protein
MHFRSENLHSRQTVPCFCSEIVLIQTANKKGG